MNPASCKAQEHDEVFILLTRPGISLKVHGVSLVNFPKIFKIWESKMRIT